MKIVFSAVFHLWKDWNWIRWLLLLVTGRWVWTRLNFQYLNQGSICGLVKKRMNNLDDMLDKEKIYTSGLNFWKFRYSLSILKSLCCLKAWDRVEEVIRESNLEFFSFRWEKWLYKEIEVSTEKKPKRAKWLYQQIGKSAVTYMYTLRVWLSNTS